MARQTDAPCDQPNAANGQCPSRLQEQAQRAAYSPPRGHGADDPVATPLHPNKSADYTMWKWQVQEREKERLEQERINREWAAKQAAAQPQATGWSRERVFQASRSQDMDRLFITASYMLTHATDQSRLVLTLV